PPCPAFRTHRASEAPFVFSDERPDFLAKRLARWRQFAYLDMQPFHAVSLNIFACMHANIYSSIMACQHDDSIQSNWSETMGPLNGIRVLDLTAVVLGPMATQVLADYGADVIKVESVEGDLMRANGMARHRGMSSTFMNLNRNKRSAALDLKTPEGRQAVLKLAETCDVLVHNMRVKAINRLGLGYDEVARVNPNIVYCAATGFGEDGAFAGQPAFDDVIQGACGLASLVGHEAGRPEYPPTLLADKVAGLATANAVLGAMVHRYRTGEGQYI